MIAASSPPVSSISTLFEVVRSQLDHLVLSAQSAGLHELLPRVVVAGALWAIFAQLLGGLYVRPWQMPGVALRISYTVAFTLCEYAARGFKPLFDEWTLPFELLRALARCLMSNYGDLLGVVTCVQHFRRQSELAGTVMGFFAARRLGVVTHSFHHNGLEHMWVQSSKPAQASNKPRRRVVVLYFHGGGYAVLSPRMYIHFGCELQYRIHNRLRDKLGPDVDVDVDLLLANYRKIPEHPHPVPALDALAMYKYLLTEENISSGQIIVAGDSAGGGLAMSTLLRLRDENPSLMPIACFLLCPFVDLEVGGDERKVPYCVIGDKAAMAIYELYHPRKGDPSSWGDASAVHCDLSGLPPVYIQAAEFDYVLPHSKRLYAKAKQDGATDWDLEIFHNMPHIFRSSRPQCFPPRHAVSMQWPSMQRPSLLT